MGRMSYEEACDAGYDGPSPFEERRMAARRRNNPSDPRDPDHDESLVEGYSEDGDEDDSGDYVCENCGQGHTSASDLYGDVGRCVSCCDGSDEDGCDE